MRVRSARARWFTTAALAASLIWTGCDPKLTGPSTPGGDDNNNDDAPQITDAARAVGKIVALHTDLIQTALQHAADYDSAATATTRSIFTTTCIDVATVDPVGPLLEMSLDTCVDGNGTEYRGRVGLEPVDGVDGFLLAPYGDPADRILATNDANPVYNHVYEQGALTFTFTRGTGGITHVEVSSALRHNVHTTFASFQYVNFEYLGSPGSFAAWPTGEAYVQVSWDGVGVFTIETSGGAQGTFTLQGVDYAVNFSTGEVSLPVS